MELRQLKSQKKASQKISKMIQQKMMADYQRRLRLQEFEAIHKDEITDVPAQNSPVKAV